jgi:transposase
MTAPGVGPIVAMTYRTVIDVPARFQRSRTVGAHIGLTYRAKRSGKSDPNGPISRWGDKGLRSALYTAGQVILMPGTGPSDLRDWGLAIAARRGRRRANIAVARRLAVILHTMWVDGTDFKATMAIG